MEQIVRTSKQLGAVIRRHRRSARLRQAQLGAKTNLRQATISALERGEPGTELRTVIDVMTALGIESDGAKTETFAGSRSSDASNLPSRTSPGRVLSLS